MNSIVKGGTHKNRQSDREAHAYSAVVKLAQEEKYFAALGPDSLAPLSKLYDRFDYS